MPQPGGDSSRLARAIQIGLEFRASGRTDVEAFLREHEHLRDLLEAIVLAEPVAVDLAASNDPSSPPGAPSSGVPKRFGAYVVDRELGRGGMGTVYLARQPGLDRPVALKVLTAPTLLVSERSLTRFQREARLLARLDHPHIVRIVDTGVHDGMPFLVMELVRGASLAAILAAIRRAGGVASAGGTLRAAVLGAAAAAGERLGAIDDAGTSWRLPDNPVAAVVTLAAEVAEALAHAHAHGIVHRDVKPGNVLVRDDGRALLVDFGVARPDDAVTLTATGDLAGTPNYMAPEQARGGRVDERTDVWALGVTLYEALTLQLPFVGDTAAKVVQQLLQADPVDPRRHQPAVPVDLAAVLHRALAKDPAGRYQTAAEFAEELRAILADRPVRARLPGALERAARWARREPWRAAAALLAFLATIAVVVVDQAHAAELRAESQRKQAALAEVNRLAIGVRLDRAIEAARPFRWPEVTTIPAIDTWLRTHRDPLAADLPAMQALLERLRAEALPYDDEQRQQDRSQHPDATALALLVAELAAIAALPAEGLPPQVAARRDRLVRDEAVLRSRVEARRTWRLLAAERQFLHDEVARAVLRLQEFLGPRGLAEMVARRAARSAECHRRCLVEAAELWRRVAREIAADPRFAGLQLAPQRDLLPLGKDPKSGLWEFVHLPSGQPGNDVPPRRDDGSLASADGAGIVFVLVPGGEFLFGAQAADPKGPNFDANALKAEGPVQPVTLAPFFVAKFELTRSQWSVLTDGEVVGPPTSLQPSGAAPAEGMTQQRAVAVLGAFALALPTEAQWEFACRAGTSTTWSFGERRLGAKYANFAGKSAPPGAPHDADVEDDGHRHVVVPGTFAPNAFGLHDLHGNVAELTCDPLGPLGVRRDDGRASARSSFDELRVVLRGGHYQARLVECRVAARTYVRNTAAMPGNGLRAVRQVTP